MPKGFIIQIVGLVAIIVVVAVLTFAGLNNAAFVVAYPGTLLFLLGILGWIVLKDSRRRWPGVAWYERFLRVMTFTR